MNKKLLQLLLVFFVSSQFMIAQKNCEKKINITRKQLEKPRQLNQDKFDEIEKFIQPCLSDDGISNYIKGLLELKRKPYGNLELSREFLEKAASLKYTKAKTYLGYFYKYGIGVPIDYIKSRYWIEQAAQEGDDNAIYMLGYFNLKGLAGLEPNYEKAVIYFQQSNLPMAKHWLAFCEYFGFGTNEDQDDALRILSENPIPNSKNLNGFLSDSDNPYKNGLEDFEKDDNLMPINDLSSICPLNLKGMWIEKDWKNEKIIRKLPVDVNLTYQNSHFGIKILLEGVEYYKESQTDDDLSLKDFTIAISPAFSKKEGFHKVHYSINHLSFSWNEKDLIYDVNVSSWDKDNQEQAPPITLRLMSQEAINNRINSSFSTYPNSFDLELNVAFEIERDSDVTITLYDFNGFEIKKYTYPKCKIGKHIYTFTENKLKSGMYFALLSVNGYTFSRQVIKTN